MIYHFVCKNCGSIKEYNEEQGTKELKCDTCHELMGWKNKFPPLSALDFINTSEELLKLSKESDKENLNNRYNLINCHKYAIDKTALDTYINQYEKHLEKYPDNDDTIWLERMDRFEDILCENMDSELAIAIVSVLASFNKNYFRKPYIIIVASLIEQLFADYFTEAISTRLSESGKRVFLGKYDTAGIQSAIEIVDSFLDESLHEKMDRYSKGFYDRWNDLRRLRNSIIHSNNKYITKIKVSQIRKLVEESCLVFLNLQSEIYKNNSDR